MSRVYFIKPVGMDGPIKVGCSYSPEGRRKTLDTWSPFALEIIAEIDGDFQLERRFHALFAETHQRREWFGMSKRMAATIAAINDGSFDVATLPAPIHISSKPRSGNGSRVDEWSPARRFSVAYWARRKACQRRGMPTSIHWPYFGTWGVADGNRYRPYTRDEIVSFEHFAAQMTAQYGHDGMKPVRWTGEYPPLVARTTDTPAERAAA